MDKPAVLITLILMTGTALGLGYWLLPPGGLRDALIFILGIGMLFEFYLSATQKF